MTALAESNPTLARRELAVIFRNLREQRKHTLDEMAHELGVSVPQASRLDTGARGYRAQDVERLCAWYGLADSERHHLLVLAKDNLRRGWWQQVDLPDSYRTLIGLEQAAVAINEYCSSAYPRLLQTRAYARAVATGGDIDITSDRAALAADVRMRRQAILNLSSPPKLWVVIDEAALARVAGGPAVMLDQLERLQRAVQHPAIQAASHRLPRTGIHPGNRSQLHSSRIGRHAA